jgi:hypothetical protein
MSKQEVIGVQFAQRDIVYGEPVAVAEADIVAYLFHMALDTRRPEIRSCPSA